MLHSAWKIYDALLEKIKKEDNVKELFYHSSTFYSIVINLDKIKHDDNDSAILANIIINLCTCIDNQAQQIKELTIK